ncbi:MAG: DNA translocase FtsK [Candidatus Velthaea sp.]
MRRKTAATGSRLNFEIAGIAAIGLALLLWLVLVLPAPRSGILGGAAASVQRYLFGDAAAWFPFLIALIGTIVFLEINVPRMIATLGSAAAGYFLIGDAALGARGGALGHAADAALAGLFGDVAEKIVLALAGLSITVWITNVSVKRIIGWSVARGAALVPLGGSVLLQVAHLRVSAPVLQPAAADRAALAAVTAPPPAPLAVRVRPLDDAEGESEYVDDEDDYDYEDDAEHAPAYEAAVERTAPELAPPPAAGNPAPQGRTYRLPDLHLFEPPQAQKIDDSSRATILEDTLASFGVGAKVTHIERGPSITRYELRPERGVKISRISALADDLALALAATSVRIEAPIPGKSAVGIEVPNASVSIVAIREIFESLPQRGTVPPLNMALGKDITGRPVFGDLAKMPHLLVAGATGSGKSVCLNCIIASLLVNATPDQVQLLMIDPKRVELGVYNGIPHLIKEVITDPRLAAGALLEMTKEMDQRYERFAKAGVRKIEEYNAKFPEAKLPYVVIIIDELADLMLIAPGKVETTICRLAQLARATGIHLIVATQRPSVDVITGIIKANIPSRIAFAVSSQVDSRTILDMGGAERLLGRGDMLYLPIDAPKPVRSQGALITGGEISRLVDFWAAQARPENLLDVEVAPLEDDEDARRNVDPLCYDAAKFIIETSYASTAQLQSQFAIGHPRAVRLMKLLEDFKVVGPHEGTKPRKILLGLGDLETIAPRLGRTQAQPELF